MSNKQDHALALALATTAGCLAGAAGMYLFGRRRISNFSSIMRLEGKKSLQPNWQSPQTQHPPHATNGTCASIISLKPVDLKSPYSFGVSAVTPRPIALVSTVSLGGVPNLAPFSYFGLMGHDPLTLAFAPCAGREGKDKDTLANIKANGECVIHIISDWFIESANYTSGNFDPEVDEFEVAGFTSLPSLFVAPPRVAESAIQLECRLKKQVPIKNADGKTTSTICVCEVVMVHMHEDVLDERSGTIKPEKLRTVSRLGGNTYGQTREMFDLSRPKVD